MKTFVAIFISSAVFGVAIALAYWFIAHKEATGTVLLGVMTAALLFSSTYAIVAERDANLDGDRENALPGETAGEDLGVFTTDSAWPPLTALSALGILLGIIWSPFLAAAALVCLLLCLWRLGAESART